MFFKKIPFHKDAQRRLKEKLCVTLSKQKTIGKVSLLPRWLTYKNLDKTN